MKKSCIPAIAAALLFLCSSVLVADDWKNESGKGPSPHGDHKGRHDDSDYRDHKKGRDSHGRDDHQKRPDYYKHQGYRERPHDKHRHYEYRHHKGHQYAYQGHWNSWAQWESHAKNYAPIYKQGSYYREDSHLMFRFCDPGSGSCFFFSIGK